MISKNIAAKSHKGVQKQFHEIFLKTNLLPQNLNKTVTKTFNLRQGGDYDSDFMIERLDAEIALLETEEFVKTVIEYLKNDSKN